MKLLRMLVAVLFAASAVLLGVSSVHQYLTTDRTYPTITCPADTLSVSVADGEDALLAGVTAYDEKDGDLTSEIMVDVALRGKGSAEVTYVVTDSDDHVAYAVRSLQYTDYEGIQFSLTSPLRYNLNSTVKLLDRLTAGDSVTGDLTDFIRVTANSFSTTVEGTYPVVFQVANNIGDSATITLDIEIRNTVSGEPVISLSDYIIYVEEGETVDPLSYVTEVKNGSVSNVKYTMPEGGLQTGTNQITLTCESDSGISGHTVLYVVVK